MQRNKISAAAIAACSLLALTAIPNAFAGSISCDDVSLPKTNENHYYYSLLLKKGMSIWRQR